MNKAIFSLLALPLLIFGVASSASAFGGHVGMRMGYNMGENADTEITKLDNGIQIRMTSVDAESIARMHEMADRHAMMQSITRTITNLENGVQIDMTSDNADAIAELQSREQRAPRQQNDVTLTQENLINGVRVTITSTDADEIEMIQSHHENGNMMKYGIGKGGFGRKGRGFEGFNGQFGR